MNVILSPVKLQFALGYLNDIIMLSRTAEEHIKQICTVLSLLQRAGVKLELKKCKLSTEKIDYMRHVIRPGRLELAGHSKDAICDSKAPQKLTELKELLGLYNVQRHVVPNFARIAAPLNT